MNEWRPEKRTLDPRYGQLLGKEDGGFVSNNRFHDEVLAYITEHGETGVNTLAKALDVPLSTMQKFLTSQKYFKKTESRKWDLPHKVNADIKSDTLSLMVDSVENALKLLDAQFSELRESVQSAFIPVNTLKRGVTALTAPVANKTSDIHPYIRELDKKMQTTQAVFKKYVGVCPIEYQELIKNLDLYRLMGEKGTLWVNGNFNTEISSLFLEKSTELSETVINALKEYQREA